MENEIIKAACIIVNENNASSSLIQRRLLLGYNRASRIMEELEKLSIISKADASGIRNILVDKEGLEKIIQSNIDGFNKDEFDSYFNSAQSINVNIRKEGNVFSEAKKWRGIKNFILVADIILFAILMLGNNSEITKKDDAKVIAASGLNIRLEPKTNSKIVATVPNGEYINIIDETGPLENINNISAPWYKVSYKKYQGWCWSGMIKKTK